MKKKENTLSSKNKSKMQEKYTEHVNDHKSKKVNKISTTPSTRKKQDPKINWAD